MSEPITELFEKQSELTSEERRVSVYSDTEPPTIPSQVGHNTPLESLRLNWREKDLPEKERTKHVHWLHPYLGKFIPQLVEIFLRKYFVPNQTVLDPFCGSGTTLVQANELGINAIGYDIWAFNVLLTRAKIRKYSIGRVRTEVLYALEKLRRLTQSTSQLGFWQERAAELQIPQTDDLIPDTFLLEGANNLPLLWGGHSQEGRHSQNIRFILLYRI